jgi:hypothetical protein
MHEFFATMLGVRRSGLTVALQQLELVFQPGRTDMMIPLHLCIS